MVKVIDILSCHWLIFLGITKVVYAKAPLYMLTTSAQPGFFFLSPNFSFNFAAASTTQALTALTSHVVSSTSSKSSAAASTSSMISLAAHDSQSAVQAFTCDKNHFLHLTRFASPN